MGNGGDGDMVDIGGLPFLEKFIGKASTYVVNFFRPCGFKRRSEVFQKLKHTVGKPNKNGYEAVDSLFGVFNFPAVYKSGLKGSDINPKKVPEATRMLIDFFSSAICGFDFTYCKNENGEKQRIIFEDTSAKTIVDDVLLGFFQKENPQTIVVDGNIGCGKSTILAVIMREIQSRSTTSIKYIPIKIDLREDFKDILSGVVFKKEKNVSTIIESISEKLFQFIRRRLKEGGVKPSGNEDSISDLLNTCYRSSHSVVIVIDELDSLYYDFCCASADPYSGIVQDELNDKYLEILGYFLELARNEFISSQSVFGSVLFVAARTSTLRLLDDIKKDNLLTPHKSNINVNHRLKLYDIDKDKLNLIILKRLKYIHKNALKSEGGNDAFIRNIKKVIKHIEVKSVDYDKNIDTSVHGIRHIMKILSSIDSHDPSGELLSLLAVRPGLLRIYQYIDGCVDYSQTLEGVSNIFLINRDFKLEQIRANEIVPSSIPKGLLCDHLQTYWLKYFVLKLIVTTDKKSPICANDIVETFCKSNDKQDNLFYESEVAHLILLHMTEVVHGRLIKLGTDKSLVNTRVIPSSRANKFIDEDLFWEFSYLFVIIEDDWILIPKVVSDDFIIKEQWQRTHHFITNYHKLSNAEKYKFVEYKTRLVFIFLALLDVSLADELERYAVAFERYAARTGGETIKENYVRVNLNKTVRSIKKFTNRYVSSDCEQKISTVIDEIKKKRYLENKIIIRKAYDDYYITKKTVTSVASKMNKYHKERTLEPLALFKT